MPDSTHKSRGAALSRPLASALLAATALLLPACGRRQTAVDRGNATQTLYRGLGSVVRDLDPQRGAGIDQQAIAAALFEGLVREDPTDLHPIPGAADFWTISPDGLRYTFHVRADARWSNGDPVTAADFRESWRRMLSPEFGAPDAELLFVMKHAEAYHRGAVPFDAVGVRTPAHRTVQITLEHPTPYFLSLLCHMAWMPVPVKVIAAHGSLTTRDNRWAEPGSMVCDGPFLLRSWPSDQDILVRKSSTYWDSRNVRLNGIHFYPMESVDAEDRAFRAGQLHLTDAVPPARIAAYRAEHPSPLRVDPYLATYFYRINVRRPGLTDPRVRRALALAIDRRSLVDHILEGTQSPANAFTPPGMAGYTPDPLLKTNFDEARKLLADAGYPGGKGLPPLTLTFNTSELHRQLAEAIQGTWARELGLQVRLRNEEYTTMIAAEAAGDYALVRAAWVADYADPTAFLDVFRATNPNNRTGWSNPRYDALLNQAERTSSEPARIALFRQAEDLLLTEAPIIPIYYYTHVFLIRPSVQGWHPTLLDHHPYQSVWLTSAPGRP